LKRKLERQKQKDDLFKANIEVSKTRPQSKNGRKSIYDQDMEDISKKPHERLPGK
jgi:hypothetical protein